MIRNYLMYYILNIPMMIILIIYGEVNERVVFSAVIVFMLLLLMFIDLIVLNKKISIVISLIELSVIVMLGVVNIGLEKTYFIPLSSSLIILLCLLGFTLKDKYAKYFYMIVIVSSIIASVVIHLDYFNITFSSMLIYQILATVGILVCNTYVCKNLLPKKPTIRLKMDN